jgi:hypothetical protein
MPLTVFCRQLEYRICVSWTTTSVHPVEIDHFTAEYRRMNQTEGTIARHKTAIRRPSYSLPIKCLLRDGLIYAETSVFDYGCGHGQDIELLRGSGTHIWPGEASLACAGYGQRCVLEPKAVFRRIPRRHPLNTVLGSRRSGLSDLSHLLTPPAATRGIGASAGIWLTPRLHPAVHAWSARHLDLRRHS